MDKLIEIIKRASGINSNEAGNPSVTIGAKEQMSLLNREVNHIEHIKHPLRVMEHLKTYIIIKSFEHSDQLSRGRVVTTIEKVSKDLSIKPRITEIRLKELEREGFIDIYPRQDGIVIKVKYLEVK